MPDREAYELVGSALSEANRILESSGRRVDGVILLVELDGEGVTIAATDTAAERLSTVLAEASWRAAGAGA